MIDKIRHILHVVFAGKQQTEETKRDTIQMRTIVSTTLAVVALVLSMINVITSEYIMLISTLVLSVSFFICVALIYKFQKLIIAEVITSITIIAVFSFYALYGKNDGFAILWILLVPAVGYLFLSFKTALGISIYFLLFNFLVFYTPLKQLAPGMANYNAQFQIRFPVLYLSSFVLATILSTQTLYFSIVSQNNSLYDFLTDLKNRRYCNDYLNKYKGKEISRDLTVLSIDINNLKTINDTRGHNVGDQIIVAAALTLKEVFKGKTEYIYRMGGDEFTVFFHDKNNEVDSYVAKINEYSKKTKVYDETLSMSIGYAKSREYIRANIPSLMKIAENNMYKCKEEYYRVNNIDRRRKSVGSLEEIDFNKRFEG